MTDRQQKIIRYALVVVSIIALLLVIILAPILTDQGVMHNAKITDLETVILVLIPILVGSNCLSISFFFKPYLKEDALRALQKAHRYGKISDKHLKETMRHIELLEVEQRKEKAMIEIEKQKYYKEVENEKNKIIKDIKKDKQ